jgi:hypothetical protein
MSNPAFPSATSGNGLSSAWTGSAATAICTFAGQYQSAIASGWKISSADLAVANIVLMSTTSPGAHYTPPLTDPLWDI